MKFEITGREVSQIIFHTLLTFSDLIGKCCEFIDWLFAIKCQKITTPSLYAPLTIFVTWFTEKTLVQLSHLKRDGRLTFKTVSHPESVYPGS